MLITHLPINGKPAFFYFNRMTEGYDRYNNPKNYKSDHNLSEKKQKKNKYRFSIFLYVLLKIRG